MNSFFNISSASLFFALTLVGCGKINTPSDEEMIKHFYGHKKEIEEIVYSYRNYPEPIESHYLWHDVKKNIDLMKKSGVRRVNHMPLFFFPEPYSPAAAMRISEFLKKPDYGLYIKHGAIKVSLDDHRYYSSSIKYGILLKDYYFFPEAPKIEDGWLLVPDATGVPRKWLPVLNSLNRPPQDFAMCLLRKIELNWFICLCRSGAGHS